MPECFDLLCFVVFAFLSAHCSHHCRCLIELFVPLDFLLLRPGSYKLFGTGPGRIKPEMISKYYRYNSGSKCFVELKGAKHTTSTTCGVQLLPGCYRGGKGGGGGGGGKPLFMRGGE